MKRNIVFAMLVLFVAISCSKSTLPAEKKDCKKLDQKIKKSISQLNYCRKDNDCEAVLKQICPFGCYWLINKKADLSEANKQIDDFFSQGCGWCQYRCVGFSIPIKCKKKRCIFEHKTK